MISGHLPNVAVGNTDVYIIRISLSDCIESNTSSCPDLGLSTVQSMLINHEETVKPPINGSMRKAKRRNARGVYVTSPRGFQQRLKKFRENTLMHA